MQSTLAADAAVLLDQAQRDVRSAFDARALATLADLPRDARRLLLTVRALANLGRLDEMEREIEGAEWDGSADEVHLTRARWLLDREVQTSPAMRELRLRALAKIAATPTEPHPAVFSDETTCAVCPRPGADVVVLNFGLWLPSPTEDRLFAAAGCSTVHVRRYLDTLFRADPARVFAEQDVIQAELFELCRSTGASRVIACGASGRSLTALLAGARFKATGVLTFSPVSTFDPTVLEALKDGRVGSRQYTQSLLQRSLVAGLDALPDMERSPVPNIVVCGAVRVDRMHADRLETAPLVRVIHRPDAGHHTALAAIADGSIFSLLDELAPARTKAA